MMNKLMLALLVVVVLSTPAMAIEPLEGASTPFKNNVAFTSQEFNEALGMYGLKLTAEAAQNVPSKYAKVEGDMVEFNDKAQAYTPEEYHAILTAYGLVLMPENVVANPISPSYASVQGDSIVFSKRAVTFKPEEWVAILKAYSMAK